MHRSLAAVAVAALGAVALAQPPAPPAAPTPKVVVPKVPVPPPVTAVTADLLAETFATNELRADELFADKVVQVTGRFARVTVNRTPSADGGKDAYQVELEGKAGLPADVDITFYFDRAARDKLSPLLAGQTVILQGRCERAVFYPRDGRVRPKDYLTVAVSECTLVGIVPEPQAPLPGALPLVVRP